MSNSLQDQLLKSGLISDKAAKKAKKDKHHQQKQARKQRTTLVDENKEAAEKAKQEKIAKDQELNRIKNQKAEEKAIQAQIKQLIESNTVLGEGEIVFNFKDDTVIKSLKVSNRQRTFLINGRLAIVKNGEIYAMVPYPVAEKIAERDEGVVLVLNRGEEIVDADDDEEDPYADFQVPDDLIW